VQILHYQIISYHQLIEQELENKRHSEVLEYINCSNKVVGIIPTLLNGGICLANYFIESSYKDGSGKTKAINKIVRCVDRKVVRRRCPRRRKRKRRR